MNRCLYDKPVWFFVDDLVKPTLYPNIYSAQIVLGNSLGSSDLPNNSLEISL